MCIVAYLKYWKCFCLKVKSVFITFEGQFHFMLARVALLIDLLYKESVKAGFPHLAYDQ